MAEVHTPILDVVKPEVGGSRNIWGNRWNENADKIEGKFRDLSGALLSAGSAAALTLTTTIQAAHVEGTAFRFRSHIACSADATLNVNGQGAKRIIYLDNSATIQNAKAGTVKVGGVYDAYYRPDANSGVGAWLLVAGALIPDAPSVTLDSLGGVAKKGDQMGGHLTSVVIPHGTLGAVTETYAYANTSSTSTPNGGNTHSVTVAASSGTHTINPTGLVEGGTMRINMTWQSGAWVINGVDEWIQGNGDRSTTFGGLGAGALVVNRTYFISLFKTAAGKVVGSYV